MNHDTPDHYRQHLQELSQRYLGARQPVTWTRMPEGVSTVVYRAERGDERFYLRVLPEEGATFAPEVRTHQLAGSLGCSVPEVLTYEAIDPVLGRSTMLTTEIPGRPLSPEVDPADAEAIARAAGRDLARINSIAVSGFGWVKRDSADVPDELAAEYPDLESMLATEYRQGIDALPDGAVPGIDTERLNHCLYQALGTVQDSSTSVLVHGDFDTTHIFVNDGQYSGILDFGEIRGMPPLYDLGHHQMHDRERLSYSTLKWLLDGHREITRLPDSFESHIVAWSLLIAARALFRGLQRDPDSQIVGIARQAIQRDVASLKNLTG